MPPTVWSSGITANSPSSSSIYNSMITPFSVSFQTYFIILSILFVSSQLSAVCNCWFSNRTDRLLHVLEGGRMESPRGAPGLSWSTPICPGRRFRWRRNGSNLNFILYSLSSLNATSMIFPISPNTSRLSIKTHSAFHAFHSHAHTMQKIVRRVVGLNSGDFRL